MYRLTERIDGITASRERYEKHSPCHHCKWQSVNKCLDEECTYGSILNKLAEYEDIGMTPYEVNQKIKRLEISPYGDDKIDELEECIENLRFQLKEYKK